MPVPLIAQHESWISVDPIVGCPAACAYCYLHPLGLTRARPETVATPAHVYDALLAHPLLRKTEISDARTEATVPIAFGNYTDMGLTPHNRAYLIELLEEHARRCPDLPVVVVTKSVLSHDYLTRLNDLGVNVIFFISLSFMGREFESGTQPWEERLENFARIAEQPNLRAVHYWRPVTSLSLPDRAAAERQMRTVMEAGAKVSVVTGLAFGEKLARLFSTDPANPLRDYFVSHVEQHRISPNIIFEADLRQAVVDVAHELNYPVYFHASCAVAFWRGEAEYSGTFRKRHAPSKCLPATCPPTQRAHCAGLAARWPAPAPEVLARLAAQVGLPIEAVSFEAETDIIHVRGSLTQAQQTFLSHATSFPVRGEAVIPTMEWVGTTNNG